MPSLSLAMLAAATAPLAPTGKWVVDFDDAQCVATRAYGQETVFLKASALGDVVQIGVAQAGRSGPPVQVDAVVTPAAGVPFKGTAVRWSVEGKNPRRMRLINMPVAEFQRLSSSPTLRFAIDDLDREFGMPDMTALARVMKSCVDDLQKVWGAGDGGGTGTKARANLASYFKDDDYPDDSIDNEQSGTTDFALLVNEKGLVADCMVTKTSGNAGLDLQSCAVIKQRARFTPALDSQGKPTKDRVAGRIRWQLP